jgi:hypothetical protein
MIHHHNPPAGAGMDHAADVQIYEALVAERNQDIAKFDHAHHFLGRMLADEKHMEHVDQTWHTHPGCFKYHHHFISQVLDGWEHRHHGGGEHPLTPEPGVPLVPGSNPPGGDDNGPGSGTNHSGNSGGTAPGGHNSAPPAQPTPEPSTFVLLALGAAGLAIVRKRRATGAQV